MTENNTPAGDPKPNVKDADLTLKELAEKRRANNVKLSVESRSPSSLP